MATQMIAGILEAVEPHAALLAPLDLAVTTLQTHNLLTLDKMYGSPYVPLTCERRARSETQTWRGTLGTSLLELLARLNRDRRLQNHPRD